MQIAEAHTCTYIVLSCWPNLLPGAMSSKRHISYFKMFLNTEYSVLGEYKDWMIQSYSFNC